MIAASAIVPRISTLFFQLLRPAPFCLLVLLIVATANAAGFKILRAETRLEKGVFLLDADIDLDLSPAALDALQNSVPLTLILQTQILHQRDWLWDETVADIEQRFRLEYHALARQYLVTNLNNGVLNSFPTSYTATSYIGQLRDFPLLDRSLLAPDIYYYCRLRAELDVESLPAPLRPVAYLSRNWDLTSEWYLWSL
jgi:hypothetical protein